MINICATTFISINNVRQNYNIHVQREVQVKKHHIIGMLLSNLQFI